MEDHYGHDMVGRHDSHSSATARIQRRYNCQKHRNRNYRRGHCHDVDLCFLRRSAMTLGIPTKDWMVSGCVKSLVS